MAGFDITPFVDFAGAIVGGILSSMVFVLIWDKFKKPTLRIEWLPHEQTIVRIGLRQLRLYHMIVYNDGRSTAENCYLKIIYRNHALEPMLTLTPGKWDANPEPVTFNPVNPNNPFFDLTFLHLIGRVSIRANSSETFCFLIKYEGDNNCYGFNADNYRPGNLTPLDRMFPLGDYMITFSIDGDNVQRESTFLMRNNGLQLDNISLQERQGLY